MSSTDDLDTLLGASSPVLQLTVSSFLKFQLKRKPMGQDGTTTFMKQATKLFAPNIAGTESQSQAGTLDAISAACVRYARAELESDPVLSTNWDAELRVIVLADLVNALKKVTETMLAAAPAAEAAPAPAPPLA